MKRILPKPSTAAIVAAVLVLMPLAFADNPERPSEGLTIIDIDGSKVSVSVDELSAMPQYTEEDHIFVGERSGFIGIYEWTGPRVVDVLRKAEAAQKASGYAKENMYLMFKGTDGYQILVSWSELHMMADGKRAMLALKCDNQPVPRETGKIRAVFPGDNYCGRSVKCLETIEIHVAEGVVEKPHEEEEK